MEILRGTATYESVDVDKYAARVSFLAGLLADAFPDSSQTGDTEAKPEVWSNRADFNRRLNEFTQHAAALSQLAKQHGGNADAFRAGRADRRAGLQGLSRQLSKQVIGV